jgi:small-conductance mechanosensitive channel
MHLLIGQAVAQIAMAGLTLVTAPADSVLAKSYLAQHAGVLIGKPVAVLAVIAAAFLIRALTHRSIDKLTQSSAEGRIPRILSPLTERAANSALFESAGLLSERRHQRTETIGSVLKSGVSFLVFITGFLIVLSVAGVNLLPFVAGTSLVGVALGFGAQNVVKDFLSGMFMILEDQYGVGDVIDVGEAAGTVEAVGLRTTRIRDTEGTVWYVRNGEIVRVGNQSQQFAQVVLDIAIGAADDIEEASSRVSAAADSLFSEAQWTPAFLQPPQLLGIESLTREETTLRLVARVRPLEQWRVGRELRARVRRALLASADGEPS